jgi:p-hydroxybenzoate 3-monooxygenase
VRLLLDGGGQRAELRPGGREAAADRRDRAGGLGIDTEVAIVGAGPAGLLLAHLLHLEGVESVVLEARDRDYVVQRVRAGVLEQGTMDTLREAGVGKRMDRQGAVHEGIELRYGGKGHRIDFAELVGRAIMVYGQQEVVKDLIEARQAATQPLHFEVDDVRVDPETPLVRYRHEGTEHELHCRAIAGCDGFHGVCRDAIPDGLTERTREYPFGWLGILAEVAPSTHELVYAHHERGFALHSLRSPELSRLYVQVDPHDDIENWPDERIWEELHLRLARDDGWTLKEGPIVEKGITPMRSFLVEPMQHGRLYLAGDAAHIVPPTGAKGLNLAVADVRVLARALTDWLHNGDESGLDAYSHTCLQRVWRVQHFSWWMTSMLHRFPDEDEIQARLQLAELDYVTSSRAASTMLAENYTGMPYA